MNTKVTMSAKNIKTMSKQMVKGRFWICALVLVLVSVGGDLPTYIVSSFASGQLANSLASLAGGILHSGLALGAANFFLAVFRKPNNANLDRVTEMMQYCIKACVMNLVNAFEVAIGGALFVIPGLVIAVRHSMASFILADNPEKGIMQCLSESNALMKGNGWHFIGLNLSYIGWFLLTAIPGSLYESACMQRVGSVIIPNFSGMTYEQIIEVMNEYIKAYSNAVNPLIAFALGLIPLLVMVYVNTSYAAFYDLANGNLFVQETGGYSANVNGGVSNPFDDDEDRETVDLDDEE